MCPVDHFKHHRKHAYVLKPAVHSVLDSLLAWPCITKCITLHFSQIHSPPEEQDGVIWDLTQVGREALPETKQPLWGLRLVREPPCPRVGGLLRVLGNGSRI